MALLERQWLLDNLELILREASFHRTNEELEQLPPLDLWHKGEEEGSCEIACGVKV